jgi:tetratricopeptide (TPR) repeat protein
MINQFEKSKFIFAAALLLCAGSPGIATAAEPPGKLRPISLLPKMGDLRHSVSTTNQMAQRFFDQGLTFIFAFNHDAAVRSFKRALEYDPNLAMAHWGIGLSLGPNINLPVSPEAEKAAYDAAQKAVELSANASEPEKDYIKALAIRYSIEPGADLQALDKKYSDAMKKLSEKYPDDLDAVTLYAESMMDLKPWQYWSDDGKPAEGTEHIIEVLESVMRRDPLHPGANHYYIHAVEASNYPERALPSAARLETFAPAAGHLVHMPAHVYLRVGDYAAAARRNEVASEADLDYVQACGVQGFYPAMYTSHNMHFAAVAHLLQGRYAASRRYAERLLNHVKPVAEQSAGFESFLPTLEQVLVGFGKWDEILALPQPDQKFKLHRGIWHYARGMAFAALNRTELAEKEAEAVAALRKELGDDAQFGPFNKVGDVFVIAENQVRARTALAKNDTEKAAELLKEVVPVEDRLRYMEPPDWYLHTREALGGVLLSAGKYSEAETVFRKDLEKNRRKGRSLYGLEAALRKRGNIAQANFIKRGFDKAWENADVELTPENIWWVTRQ